MSRNVRQKYPPTPTQGKVSKRRGSDSSSSLDLSDLSDGYSGVDEVSDSEDDDEDGVVVAEEEYIKTRVARTGRDTSSARPVQNEESDADEEDDDDDDDNSDDLDLDDDGDEDEQSASWDGIESEADGSDASQHIPDVDFLFEEDLPAIKRQVRFTGVPDSDSDSTTSDMSDDVTGLFPDIFIEQTSLDPAFRREIEQDLDDVSSNSSYWDFHDTYDRIADHSDPVGFFHASDDDTPFGTPMGSQLPTEASTPAHSPENGAELDGYETDGDTTEDDIPEPLPRKKQLRRSETVEASSDTETDTTIKGRGRNRSRPRTSRFDLDSSVQKPIAVVNPITRKMIIFTPKKDGNDRFDLSPESLRSFFSVPAMELAQSSPIVRHSGAVMMGAMLTNNTFGDFMHQPMGPVEAFFPPMNSDAIIGDESDFSGFFDEEEDEEEKRLQLDDFITFQEHSSDEEAETPDSRAIDWEEGTNADIPSTPGTRRPSTAMSVNSETNAEMHPLLAHFDNNSDAVGAFRRNQVNQQLILSDRATSESLAFSGPYSLGTLRGIKNGSLETVTTPITPARRQRRTSLSGFGDLNRSPLAGISQKRKASGMHDGNHKKQRSMSDVRDIAL